MEFMTDIETLSTRQCAVVLSVGIMAFNDDGPMPGEGGRVTFRPSVREQLTMGRAIDLSTIRFWTGCSKEAIDDALSGEETRCTVLMLHKGMRHFLDGTDVEGLWAKGPTFDLSVLENLFNDQHPDLGVPWRYNAPRDMRTMLREAERLGYPHIESVVAHTAIGDCEEQIRRLLDIRRWLAASSTAREMWSC